MFCLRVNLLRLYRVNLIKTGVINSIFTYVGNRCLKLRKPHIHSSKITSFFQFSLLHLHCQEAFFNLSAFASHLPNASTLNLPGVISRAFFLLHTHCQEAFFHLSALASHLLNTSTLKLLGIIRRAFFLLHLH